MARQAEAAGFESLWVASTSCCPIRRSPPSPMPPADADPRPGRRADLRRRRTPRRIRLGTGIIILPQRNPLVLAKELASLDVLSGGRLIFGIGVGYLEPEFDALGVPFADKGARSDEYLEAMRAIWTQPKPAYRRAASSRSSGVQAQPRPVQQPHPPIVVGGAQPAGATAARCGAANGWYGFALDLARRAACLDGLAQARRRDARPAALGPLEISVTPPPTRSTGARSSATPSSACTA